MSVSGVPQVSAPSDYRIPKPRSIPQLDACEPMTAFHPKQSLPSPMTNDRNWVGSRHSPRLRRTTASDDITVMLLRRSQYYCRGISYRPNLVR